jgi:hypothetical protein
MSPLLKQSLLLGLKIYAAQKFLETRVGAQEVESRLDVDVVQAVRTFLIGLCQPEAGLVLVPQAGVDTREINGGNISASSQSLQSLETLQGLGSAA